MRNCSKKNTVTHLIIMPFLPKAHIPIPRSPAHGHSVQSCRNKEHLRALTPLVGRVGERGQQCRRWGNRPPWCWGRARGGGMAAPALPSKGGRLLPLQHSIWNSSPFVRPPSGTGALRAAGFLQYRLEDAPWQSSAEQALPAFLTNCHLDTEEQKRKKTKEGGRRKGICYLRHKLGAQAVCCLGTGLLPHLFRGHGRLSTVNTQRKLTDVQDLRRVGVSVTNAL